MQRYCTVEYKNTMAIATTLPYHSEGILKPKYPVQYVVEEYRYLGHQPVLDIYER